MKKISEPPFDLTTVKPWGCYAPERMKRPAQKSEGASENPGCIQAVSTGAVGRPGKPVMGGLEGPPVETGAGTEGPGLEVAHATSMMHERGASPALHAGGASHSIY